MRGGRAEGRSAGEGGPGGARGGGGSQLDSVERCCGVPLAHRAGADAERAEGKTHQRGPERRGELKPVRVRSVAVSSSRRAATCAVLPMLQ